MKRFIKKEWFKIIIIILLSIITISYASSKYVYYQKQQIQLQEMKEEQKVEEAFRSEILSKLRKKLHDEGLDSEQAEDVADKIYYENYEKLKDMK